jgi:hypothetical protein
VQDRTIWTDEQVANLNATPTENYPASLGWRVYRYEDRAGNVRGWSVVQRLALNDAGEPAQVGEFVVSGDAEYLDLTDTDMARALKRRHKGTFAEAVLREGERITALQAEQRASGRPVVPCNRCRGDTRFVETVLICEVPCETCGAPMLVDRISEWPMTLLSPGALRMEDCPT